MIDATLQPVGDNGVMLRFGDNIDPDVHEKVLAADRAISAAKLNGVCEMIPSFTALMVVYDPLVTDYETLTKGILGTPPDETAHGAARNWVIPVCYDGEFSPDLADVANQKGMSEEAVIKAHTAAEFRLYMYGFAPGYAYLGGLPETLQLPRKPEPIRDRPIGTVMIAGPQCVISTLVMPTGWWMIGRTNFQIFRPDDATPFPLSVGDSIRFERVGLDDFMASGGPL